MPSAEGKQQWQIATILVADDDPDDRFLIGLAYKKCQLPYKLQFVRDGQEAIDYLQGSQQYADRQRYPLPDLFILDLKMPRLDGFDVLEWMGHAGLPKIPVMIRSGSDLEEDKRRATKLGASAYFMKSPDPAVTAERIMRMCQKWLEKDSASASKNRSEKPAAASAISGRVPIKSPESR